MRAGFIRDHRLIVTVALSLGLHVAAAGAFLLMEHVAVPVPDAGLPPAEVELVMEEHKGGLTAAARGEPETENLKAPDHTGVQPEDPSAEAARPPVNTAPEALPSPAEPVVATTPEPLPEVAEPAATASRESPPAPPAAAEPPAPVISLHGTDSPSDAVAMGDQVVPAAQDAVFHNRPPAYPPAAVRAGQTGAVVVMVYISPTGKAADVEVTSSSGYALLDRAAREAVMRWRFLPAVKAGQPVASAMTMRFIFENE